MGPPDTLPGFIYRASGSNLQNSTFGFNYLISNFSIKYSNSFESRPYQTLLMLQDDSFVHPHGHAHNVAIQSFSGPVHPSLSLQLTSKYGIEFYPR